MRTIINFWVFWLLCYTIFFRHYVSIKDTTAKMLKTKKKTSRHKHLTRYKQSDEMTEAICVRHGLQNKQLFLTVNLIWISLPNQLLCNSIIILLQQAVTSLVFCNTLLVSCVIICFCGCKLLHSQKTSPRTCW